MASYGNAEIIWNQAGLHFLLDSPGGAVGKHLIKEGVRITNIAKRKVSGPWHGTWMGVTHGSAPGQPPGVRTTRLLNSITFRPALGTRGFEVQVGTNVFYGAILELRKHAPYPWLKPSFEDAGYTVHMFV